MSLAEKYVGRILEVYEDWNSVLDEWVTHIKVWDDKTNTLYRIPVAKSLNFVSDATSDTINKAASTLIQGSFLLEWDIAMEEYNKPLVGDFVKVQSSRTGNNGVEGKVVFKKNFFYRQAFDTVQKPKLCIATSDRIQKVHKYGKTYDQHVDVVWEWEHNTALVKSDRPLPEAKEVLKKTIEKLRSRHAFMKQYTGFDGILS